MRGSDIDHVLIGWGGVYTINTKTHPGGRVWVGRNAVRVNGHAVPYLRNSRFEAQRAERLLSTAAGFAVPVRPVLVFLTGSLVPNVTIKGGPDDVLVLDRMDIPGAFRRAPERLRREQVEVVFEMARRSTTWRDRTYVTVGPARRGSAIEAAGRPRIQRHGVTGEIPCTVQSESARGGVGSFPSLLCPRQRLAR